jgi:hypothetical protein
MNWGKGITLVMIAFMSFILYMAFTLMSKSTELESDDYYKKEIEYDQEQNALQNASDSSFIVKIKDQAENLVFQFPKNTKPDSISIYFFRPNDQKLDKHFYERNTNIVIIPKKELSFGNYYIHIDYIISSKKYLQKENWTVK